MALELARGGQVPVLDEVGDPFGDCLCADAEPSRDELGAQPRPDLLTASRLRCVGIDRVAQLESRIGQTGRKGRRRSRPSSRTSN
jgi:hypothetical protein